MSRRDLSVKGGTSERCYRTSRGRTDEQRYAIISPYFDGRIKMNGPYPEITNISFLAKLFFKTFISLKHLSDYRIIVTAPLKTYLAAFLCICSTRDICWVFWMDPILVKSIRQLDEQVMCTKVLNITVQFFMFLGRKTKVLLAFVVILLICGPQSRLLLIVTPK
jgi:hypothetical protein